MKNGSKVRQRDPTSLFTEGVHPLPDIKYESAGNQTTPVLPITKQPNIWKKEVSSFSSSAWKSQQGAYAHHGRTHPVLSQPGRERPNCRARFRSSSQSSMRQKLTEMRFHQLIMGLAGLFSSVEIVNAASIADTTIWCEGTPAHLEQEGTVHCHFAKSSAPKRSFWELLRQTFRFGQWIGTCQAAELRELRSFLSK